MLVRIANKEDACQSVRIVNREDSDQTALKDSVLFGLQLVFEILKYLP